MVWDCIRFLRIRNRCSQRTCVGPIRRLDVMWGVISLSDCSIIWRIVGDPLYQYVIRRCTPAIGKRSQVFMNDSARNWWGSKSYAVSPPIARRLKTFSTPSWRPLRGWGSKVKQRSIDRGCVSACGPFGNAVCSIRAIKRFTFHVLPRRSFSLSLLYVVSHCRHTHTHATPLHGLDMVEWDRRILKKHCFFGLLQVRYDEGCICL